MSFSDPQAVNPNDPTQATSGTPATNPNTDMNRLLQQLQKKVQDLETANSSGGPPPIGSILAYAGSGDPPGGEWVVCDGRLVDKTAYSNFFAAVGHVYNGGVDPGGNMVRIPDKRGRCSRGAIDMGTGPAVNDNTRSQTARGASGGEVSHTLSATESGLPSHGHSVTDPGHGHSLTDPGHGHSVSDPGHGHTSANANSAHSLPGTDGTITPATLNPGTTQAGYAFTTGSWITETFLHSHIINTNSTGLSVVSHTTGVSIGSGTTGISVGSAAAAAASQGHNNLDPYEADTYIVRIA